MNIFVIKHFQLPRGVTIPAIQLRAAAKGAGVIGVSTHSFRRTALTIMRRSEIPLRTIQQISGHSDLGTLQRYLEVDPEEVRKAINTISL